MNPTIRPLRALAALAAIALGAVAPPPAAAEAGKPPALQGIMRQLGEDMQQVTHAISMEDWQRVARLAPGIARHAQPPAGEKVRILGWLGSDAAQFRGFDGAVHETATALIDDGCYEVLGFDADGRAFKARIDPETLRGMKLKTRDQRERHHHRDEAGKTSGNAHESHASNVTSRPTSLPENAPCPAP